MDYERPEVPEAFIAYQHYCPHGLQPFQICAQCAEQRRREEMEARNLEVFERLIATLELLNERLA